MQKNTYCLVDNYDIIQVYREMILHLKAVAFRPIVIGTEVLGSLLQTKIMRRIRLVNLIKYHPKPMLKKL